MSGATVNDHGILFVVPAQAAGVKVGAAHRAEAPVDHDNFGVMESWLIDPHIRTTLHQFVHVVEHAVGCKGNIAFLRHHDFQLDATLDSFPHGFFQFVVQREIRIDEFDAVASVVDGFDIEFSDNLIRYARFAVDDAHHLMPSCSCGVGFQTAEVQAAGTALIILGVGELLVGYLLPDTGKDALQRVHLCAFYPTMHVAPRSHLLRAVDVIVGHVHPSRIGYLSVDDHDLAVVAREHMVDPREAHRVEFVNLNAFLADGLQVFLFQRTVVGVVAKAIEQGANLHSLSSFGLKQ